MAVLSFHAGLQRRVDQAGVKAWQNGQVVTLDSGATIRKYAVHMTALERRALATDRELGRFMHDAETSGVPLRTVQAAWNNYREARNLLAKSCELSTVRVTYDDQRGDCRNLLLVRDDAPLGVFSILDGNQPRSSAAVFRDLQRLTRGE